MTVVYSYVNCMCFPALLTFHVITRSTDWVAVICVAFVDWYVHCIVVIKKFSAFTFWIGLPSCKHVTSDIPPGTDCPYPIRILAFFY